MPVRKSLVWNRWAKVNLGWHGRFLSAMHIDSDRSVWILLTLFGTAWLTHLMSVALTAPMDNIEQWVWSHSLQWGYHKHPPLPTWLLAWAQTLTSSSIMTSAVLGSACTLGSTLIFTHLIRQIWGRPSAFIALLAALCITFYNGRLNYYNHNVLLMLCVSLSALCWWNILTTGRLRWWMALGASAGLGILSKYQYLLVLAPSACLLWQIKPWRHRVQMQGLFWAVLTAVLICLPHLVWLWHQDLADSPIRYALKTSKPDFLQNTSGISHRLHSGIWLMDLLFNRCLPALLLLLGLKAFSQPVNAPVSALAARSDVPGDRFLLLWGSLPPLCITLLGLTLGLDLQMQWGTAFAIWAVPVMMLLLNVHQRWICQSLTWIAAGMFVLIQGVLMLHSYQTSAHGCCASPGGGSMRWRLLDSPALARELEDAARNAIGGKFTVIAGPASIAGAVALNLAEQPKVLIDGNLRISPWVHENELLESGVVEIWPPNKGPEDKNELASGWSWRIHAPDNNPF